MKKIFKWGFIGFIILIVISAIAGSDSSSPKKIGVSDTATKTKANVQDKTKIFKIGDKVNLNGKTIIVNGVKAYTSQNQFLAPKSGNKFVAVDVTLRNDSEEAYNYNVLEFSLQDNQDYSYSNATTDIKPCLTVGAIQPGQTTRGFIAFEIPSENESVKLVYTPSFWGTAQVIIELR